ncbi:hypothetical protein GA0074692_2851 [Micromonospora pallida]|uniref:Uncharacterized protein n=1 Tax=Micromonospora pallida TaxID=145854 RepID=A0A1C6SKI7_9ACTN|nr:hypothetical protein [Micromonospora pallida]SCL30054.1 hypothetical protein GA0074692_2851 [Micromonospora pallida]
MTTTTAIRFTNSQRAGLMVCAPVRLALGALAHHPARHTIPTSEQGKRARHITTPACQPDPDPADPNAGRGWAEYTAGWADHLGALACPTCYPPEGAA